MTATTDIDLDLLPHLRGWEHGPLAPIPWRFGHFAERQRAFSLLPPRVWPVVLCDCAESVLPVWERYDGADRRPHQSIADRLVWCRVPTAANLERWDVSAADAASTADAARAADAAHAAQWRYTCALYRRARAPLDWSEDWHTSTVRKLAEAIWTNPRAGLHPILADALEDAGCTHRRTLRWLRSERGPHGRSGCAVWLPLGLGKERGA